MPNTITKEAIETAAISIGNKVTVTGGGGAAVLAFMHQNLVAISGIAIALLGYLTSVYFQRRRDRREEAEHELTRIEHDRWMQKMETGPTPLQPLNGGQQ